MCRGPMRLLPIAFVVTDDEQETDGTTNAWAVVPVATAATATTKADLMRVHIVCSNKCFRGKMLLLMSSWVANPGAECRIWLQWSRPRLHCFVVVLDLHSHSCSSFFMFARFPSVRQSTNFLPRRKSQNFNEEGRRPPWQLYLALPCPLRRRQ